MKISIQRFVLPLIANVLLCPCIGNAETGESMTETANTITVTKFHQSYPYSGKAMVEYTVSGLLPINAIAEFTLNSGDTSATFIQKNIIAGENSFTIDFASSFDGATLLTNASFVVAITGSLGGVQLWENGPYWAECNVGALKPEEYGYYFWWGDTVGYSPSGGTWKDGYYYSGVIWVSSTGDQMSSNPFWDCPTICKDNSELLSAGYIDSTGNLLATHDAATVHLGSPWRMPTCAEFSALISNCTTTWTSTNGVRGELVTGKGAYADRSIFLPAAGFGDFSDLCYPRSYGFYWSSTPYVSSVNENCACYLSFWTSGFYQYDKFDRSYGNSIRPVQDVVEYGNAVGNISYDKYSVAFDSNGGIGGTTNYLACGVAIVVPIASREGYSFVGWLPDVDATVPASNVTYTAQWKIDQGVVSRDTSYYDFNTSSTAEWRGDSSISHDGDKSLQSGGVGNNESSWLEATVNGAGRISFWWKASSEEHADEVYDYAFASIDGVAQGALNEDAFKLSGLAIGGKTDWTNVVIDVVGDGPHTIRWTYCKDDSDDLDVGDDCVWLDDFSFLPKPTVSFEIGDLATGETPTSIHAFKDEVVILPSNEKFSWADHVFYGWSDGQTNFTPGASYVIPATNTNLTAMWIAKSFVSFDIGEGTGTPPEKIKDVPNAVVVLPLGVDFEWTDHVFDGWCDGAQTYTAGTDYIVPSSNITLVAKWIAKSFVSFDPNGAVGNVPELIKALPDEIVSLPTGEGLSLTDHVFGGWTDGVNDYAARADYTVPASNVTLAAVWIAKRFLTFTLDGGEGEIPVTIKDVPNATVTLPSADGFNKPKYRFVGWSDGTQAYEAGAEYIVTDSGVEFTAVWAANTLEAPVITSADVVNGGTIETASATIQIAATDGAAIYYTTDGTEPTINSVLYTGAFAVDGLTPTIRALAVKDNYFDSPVAEFSFTRKPYSAAECLNVAGKVVSTGGEDAAWVRVLGAAAHDGVAALQSGAIGEGGSSSVEMSVDGAGEIGFWWKTSCETAAKNKQRDFAAFYLDGTEQCWMGGITDWSNKVFTVSGDGAHSLKWVYRKNDNGTTEGDDCAWLDEVTWTPWREITTKQTAVPIPYGWFESHGLLSGDGNPEAVAMQTTGKRDGSGRLLTVMDDFIAGTDPMDESDVFRVTISISNGLPIVEWHPDLNTNGANRVYTIYGKETLDDEWVTPTNSLSHFFKVDVAMPPKDDGGDTTDGGSTGGGEEPSGGRNGESVNLIPAGYSTNNVQCVSCTGSEWYDLGLPPTLTMKTQIKCSFAGENEHMAIIGVVQPTTQWNVDEYRLFIAATPFEWFLDLPGPSRIHGTSVELNEVREVEFGNFYVKDMATDTVLLSGDTVTKACPQNNIRLFRTNYSYPNRYTTGSVYYVKIYDLNASNEYELVRNLVPCKPNDGDVGLLDLVEMKFYKNDGTSVQLTN